MYGPIPPLTLTLKRTVLKNVDDSAGRWQYTGGQVLQNRKPAGDYIGVKRVVFGATSPQNTASLTLTIFFKGQKPPQNITLQGSHDFSSGRQAGSVSAASNDYSGLIGAQFKRSANTLKITP
jgi:hypothetical protein